MKIKSEININLPLKEFVKKFDNPDNMKHWQRGLVSVEHLSGNPGVIGAKMKLNYFIEKRKMEVVETITHARLPHEFHGTFSTKGIDNIQENYFEELKCGGTKWTSISEYLPLSFNMRIMLMLMPKAFKKQSKRYMSDFKKFAEKGISVANEKA
ncbi:MAG: SRPBCC family protein [Aquaticitalea sp.]